MQSNIFGAPPKRSMVGHGSKKMPGALTLPPYTAPRKVWLDVGLPIVLTPHVKVTKKQQGRQCKHSTTTISADIVILWLVARFASCSVPLRISVQYLNGRMPPLILCSNSIMPPMPLWSSVDKYNYAYFHTLRHLGILSSQMPPSFWFGGCLATHADVDFTEGSI